MMQRYQQQQKVLNGIADQISLMTLYEQMEDPVQKTMLLSRLKHILLTTPNDTHIPAQELKHCNDKYFYFILNQIIQWTTNQPSKSEAQKKQQQSLMRMMFYVVSLRIKLWFNKMEFEDVFSSLVINIEHNRKMIPMVVEFFIQLIDVFEDKAVGDEPEDDQGNIEGKKGVHTYNEGIKRSDISRQSLTRKTNNSLFLDQQITRKTQQANKQLHESIRKKSSYRKQNKFQREFLDYELNKLLTFANQCFNRAVVQNPKYDYEQQQPSNNNQQEEELQPAYFIKMPIQHITKILQLIHRVLMFDFLGERNRNLHDEYFQQKMPQIIPSKHTKYNRFEEIENWIKNKTDAYKYQYIYFISNNIELKIQIVRIFGDMLRIHQKFFKKDVVFKTHVETVVMLIKNMLQNLQIKYNQDFQLAVVFGESINKLLLSSTFPTFLNSTKPEFKKEFIQTVSGFLHKEILDIGLLDIRLIRYYCGFFGEMYEKLMINSSEHFRVKDFKQHVQLVVRRLVDGYEENLYDAVDRNDEVLVKQFPNYYSVNQTVKQLHMDNFETLFTIFKFHQPKKHFDEGNKFTLGESVLWICSRMEFNFHQYEYLMKQSQKDSKQVKKIDVVKRHCLQCFAKLVELMGGSCGQQGNEQKRRQVKLMQYRLNVMISTFVCEKILSHKAHIVLIFQQSGQLFAFIRHVINMYFQIKLMLVNHKKIQAKYELQLIQNNRSPLCQQGSQQFNELNNLHHHAQLLFSLITKLIQLAFIERRKANFMKTQMRQLDFKIASTSKRQRNNHSYYTVSGKLTTNKRNHEDAQMVENMKRECENGQKELNYFEGIIRIISVVMGVSNSSKNDQENQQNKLFESKQSMMIKRIMEIIIHEQRQLDNIISELYRMYFVALSKYQFHRKMHCTFVKSTKHQQAQQNNMNEKHQQSFVPRKSQKSFYSQPSQQEDNEDQCSVIQQEDMLIDNSQSNNLHRCNTTIELHDLHNDMTVVGYWIWIEYALADEQIKQELEEGFIGWFIKIHHTNNAHQDLENDKNKQRQMRSYLQIYSLQSIMLRLINQYYPQYNESLSSMSCQTSRVLLLKISTMLMKVFRQSKYQLPTKKHLIFVIKDFVSSNFYQIQQSGYVLQSHGDNYYRRNENNYDCRNQNNQNSVVDRMSFGEQQQQDSLISHRVQSMVSLLQSMVNFYFLEFTTNIFNVQFLTIFDSYHQTADKDNQYIQQTIPKASPLQQEQHQWLINIFINTKSISQLFVNVIKFVLGFPEEYLQNGWYKSLEKQLIRLIREVYYEFSQFTTIFMFGLDQENIEMESRIVQMRLVKVHSSLNQQKYAVTINNTNLPNVICAYSTLIQYINKVIWLSYVSLQAKQWLMVRNRQSLPFIKQIYQFICSFKRWNDNSNHNIQLKRQQQRNTIQYQQFYQSLTKLLKTMFQFITYFLNNFQSIHLQFVTEHLSFIETIYQIVHVSRTLGDKKIQQIIDEILWEMDKVVVFRKVKEEEQQRINNKNANGHHLKEKKAQKQYKPSASKYPPPSSSKKRHYNNIDHGKLYLQQQPKHYTGWEYIKRLYQSSQTDILQEIQRYYLQYKYRSSSQRKKQDKQGGSQREDGTLTVVNSNKLEQSSSETVYEEVEEDRKIRQLDDRRSRQQNKFVMSSLKKIKPLLQESETLNKEERSEDENLLTKNQYKQENEEQEKQYHNDNNSKFHHDEGYYNQLQLERQYQHQQQEEHYHAQQQSDLQKHKQLQLNQHSYSQLQQKQSAPITNSTPLSAISFPQNISHQLPIILQQSHKHINFSKSKLSTANQISEQQPSQSIRQQFTTSHNSQSTSNKYQSNQSSSEG